MPVSALDARKPRESKVMKIVNFAGTAVMLNMLFLLACIPVVTIGPALSGLYSGVRYMIRGDGAVRGFWAGFRTNIVRMMIAGVIFTGIIAYFVIMINSAYNTWLTEDVFRDIPLYAVPAMVPMMLLCALVPLNIYIPYGVTDWLKNGVNLICKAPLWVLLTACMLAAPIACVFWLPEIAVISTICLVGFWFTVMAFVSTMFLKDGLIELLETYREENPEEEEEDDDE
jgi:hypothetical protein